MPDLTASIPHQLTRAEAKRRIQEQVVRLRQQAGHLVTNLNETWDGDEMRFSLSAMGQNFAGELRVDDQMLHLTVALPWFLNFLASGLRQQLVQQGQHLLAPVN